MGAVIPWPRAMTERLEQLWAQGLTGLAIATTLNAEFERKVTRNGVIGQVHRMGLPKRPNPVKPKGTRTKRSQRIVPPKAKDPRRLDTAPSSARETDKLADLPARPAPASEPVLRPGSECQWLMSEPRERQFCGKTCQEGFSYCPEHKQAAYIGKKVKYTLAPAVVAARHHSKGDW